MSDFDSPEWWEEKKKQVRDTCGKCRFRFHDTFSGACDKCRWRDLKAALRSEIEGAGS